jgi:hypothetical protein
MEIQCGSSRRGLPQFLRLFSSASQLDDLYRGPFIHFAHAIHNPFFAIHKRNNLNDDFDI